MFPITCKHSKTEFHSNSFQNYGPLGFASGVKLPNLVFSISSDFMPMPGGRAGLSPPVSPGPAGSSRPDLHPSQTARALKPERSRYEYSDATPEPIGGDPGLIGVLDVSPAGLHGNHDALAACGRNSFGVEDEEGHSSTSVLTDMVL